MPNEPLYEIIMPKMLFVSPRASINRYCAGIVPTMGTIIVNMQSENKKFLPKNLYFATTYADTAELSTLASVPPIVRMTLIPNISTRLNSPNRVLREKLTAASM